MTRVIEEVFQQRFAGMPDDFLVLKAFPSFRTCTAGAMPDVTAVTAIERRAAKLAGMTNLAISRQAFLRPSGGASCSVCWQEFEDPTELDQHIRSQHPERLLEPSELSRRARLRWVEGALSAAAPSRRD